MRFLSSFVKRYREAPAQRLFLAAANARFLLGELPRRLDARREATERLPLEIELPCRARLLQSLTTSADSLRAFASSARDMTEQAHLEELKRELEQIMRALGGDSRTLMTEVGAFVNSLHRAQSLAQNNNSGASANSSAALTAPLTGDAAQLKRTAQRFMDDSMHARIGMQTLSRHLEFAVRGLSSDPERERALALPLTCVWELQLCLTNIRWLKT